MIPAGLSAEPRRELLQDSLGLGAALARLVHPARHHSSPLPELFCAGAHPMVGAIFTRRAQVRELCDSYPDHLESHIILSVTKSIRNISDTKLMSLDQ